MGDYDNAKATAVQLVQAAVSTERNEAGAGTGAAVHATVTVKAANAGTQRKQHIKILAENQRTSREHGH